jgi:hypothetical protein
MICTKISISQTFREKPLLKANQKKTVLGCIADNSTVTDEILATGYRAMVN